MVSIANDYYSIGEFAKKTGLSTYTLRYYERENLIVPHRDEKQRRFYTEQDVGWVHFLMHLKGTGMSMNEIQQYITWRAQGDATIEQRKELLQNVRERSLAQIRETQNHLEILSHKIDWYDGKLDHSIQDSESFAEYLKQFKTEN
ncbi:MerR family transcriptional regulator [Fructilactobacillus carniphilus]|uniref:MerR family transcriptional regulator n=1 Tax=Fructilactobacillus carniphilus TaxID=2940297 RepID=UPI003B8499B4